MFLCSHRLSSWLENRISLAGSLKLRNSRFRRSPAGIERMAGAVDVDD